MNAPIYTLDAASLSDSGGYIDTTGPYIGRLTRAVAIKAGTGSLGVELDFETIDGSLARWISFYTHRADQSPIDYGIELMQGLMYLMQIQRLTPGQALDSQNRPVPAYPELCRAPIGLLLQKELYTKSDGSDGYSMKLVMPFDPSTRQTAAEKRDGNAAAYLEKRAAGLVDNDRREAPVPARSGPPAASATMVPFDDDVPF